MQASDPTERPSLKTKQNKAGGGRACPGGTTGLHMHSHLDMDMPVHISKHTHHEQQIKLNRHSRINIEKQHRAGELLNS